MDNENAKVVVAEDDALFHRLLERALGRQSIQLIMCKNGEEALAAFEAHKPDLMVTDWKMPKLGGAELTPKILAVNPDQKFIFITGFDKDVVRGEPWYQESYAIMVKPFTPRELAKQIEISLIDESDIGPEPGTWDQSPDYDAGRGE